MSERDVLFQTEDDLALEATVEVLPTEKFLLFISDGLLFGVSAEAVVEIITNHTVTSIPLVPDYVKGVINLRGQIIPILDIRRLLGRADHENACIIIVQHEDNQVGILVDQVEKMVDVDVTAILPVPPHSNQELVSGMCSLEGGRQTMLVFDCAQLMDRA